MKPRKEDLAKKILVYVFLTFLAIFTAVPFVWMIMTSVKPELEIFHTPPTLLPSRISLEHFDYVVSEIGVSFINFFTNTLIVSAGTLAIVIPLSLFAGYGFTRFKFRINNILFTFIIFIMMIPNVVLLVPIYQFIRSIGLLDTHLALVIVYTAFQLPLSTWIVRGYMESLPKELEESALIDGCSRISALLRILMPLCWPIIITVIVFSLMNVWNEFIYAVLILNTMEKFTLSPGLLTFFGFTQIHYGPIMASSTMATIPVFILFIAVQKLYVKGMTSGALKG